MPGAPLVQLQTEPEKHGAALLTFEEQDRSCGWLRRKQRFYDVCTSTNDVATSLVKDGYTDEIVVICNHQTGGKGRQGRRWDSWPGNLALSIVIRPQLKLALAHRIMMASALATVDALERLGIKAQIKWPNDILIKSNDDKCVEKLGPFRKVGGILLEHSSVGDWIDKSIIGLGLNLARPGPEQHIEILPQMGFLCDQRESLDLTLLCDTILESMEHMLSDGIRDATSQFLLESVKDKSVLLGKNVQVNTGDSCFRGVAENLGDDGGLIIRRGDNSLQTIYFGDVAMMPYLL